MGLKTKNDYAGMSWTGLDWTGNPSLSKIFKKKSHKLKPLFNVWRTGFLYLKQW
jgi:hypothetical protein